MSKRAQADAWKEGRAASKRARLAQAGGAATADNEQLLQGTPSGLDDMTHEDILALVDAAPRQLNLRAVTAHPAASRATHTGGYELTTLRYSTVSVSLALPICVVRAV